MTIIDRKKYELSVKVTPWLVYNKDTDEVGLRDDAPDNIRKAFIEWKTLPDLMPDLC